MNRFHYDCVAFIFGGCSPEHVHTIKMFEDLRSQLAGSPRLPYAKACFYYLPTDGSVIRFASPDQFSFTSGNAVVKDGVVLTRDEFVSQLVNEKMFVFSFIMGNEGEDGMLQGVMDFIGIPSSLGSVRSAYLSIDKWVFALASNTLSNDRLRPIESVLLTYPFEATEFQAAIAQFAGREVVLKPNRQGASILIRTSTQTDAKELADLANTIGALDGQVLIQERIFGREVSCGCIKTDGVWRALGCLVVAPPSGFMGEGEKTGQTPYKLYPLEQGSGLAQQVERISVALAQHFGFHTYCRFDYIVNEEGDIHLFEVNSKPGLQNAGILEVMLAKNGIGLLDLVGICMANETLKRQADPAAKDRITRLIHAI